MLVHSSSVILPCGSLHSRLHTRKAGVVHVFRGVCQEKMSGWHQLLENTCSCGRARARAQHAPSIWLCLLAQQQQSKGQGGGPGQLISICAHSWKLRARRCHAC